MKIVLGWLAATTLVLAQEERAEEVDPTIEMGRVHSALYFDAKLHELWDRFTPEMQSVFGGKAAVVAQRRKILAEWGREQELLAETHGMQDGFRAYSRVARFQKSSPLIEVLWLFDDEDRVASYQIRRKYVNAPTEHLEHETTTDLALPVEGEWNVMAGGRDVSTNHHAASFDQRFALDLMKVEDGRAFRGDGANPEDYFGFGEKVLAPAGGVVHVAVDGIEDSLPGVPNMLDPLGNHVVVDHENGEYSFLAHLKQGSVAVEKGARVETGDLLGLCGSSGDAKLPHVHHHLQLTGEHLKGDGLPAQFQHYVAGGEGVARGEPRQKETVRNMTAAEREVASAGPPNVIEPKTPKKKRGW